MIRSIIYVGYGNIPSRKAHAVQMCRMAAAMAECGRRVELLTQASVTEILVSEKHDLRAMYRLPAGVRARRLPLTLRSIRDPEGYFIFSENARFDRVVPWYCRLRRPDLVYTRNWPVAAATTAMGLPTVLEAHDQPTRPGAAAQKWLDIFGRPALRGLVTIAPALRDAFVELGVPGERILVAPDAVDPGPFDEANRRWTADNGKALSVGYCGHLYEGRGIDVLLEAARLLPEVRFELIGGHPYDLPQWRERAAGLENVTFHGYVPNAEVPGRLVGMDVLVMPHSAACPTIDWTSPMKMFEYMAAGRAIVASDFPGFRTILEHERNALLVEPDSPQELADSVRRLESDAGLRDALGRKARQDVAAHTWQARAERILEWIEQSGTPAVSSTPAAGSSRGALAAAKNLDERPVIVSVRDDPARPPETFVSAQDRHLPARVIAVHGRLIPHIDNVPVFSARLPARAFRKLRRLVLGKPPEWDITLGHLRVLRRYRPAAVLAQFGPIGVRVMEACRLAGVPLVVYFRGYDVSRKPVLDEHLPRYRELFTQAAALVAVSREIEQKLLAWGAPREKVHYNPSGVDCDEFQGGDPAAAPPVFLATGRFVEKKAPYLTLLAFARVHEKRPDARLRMIGTGPLWGMCHDLARALGLGEAVSLLGFQPPEVVAREMRGARCFVQHSIEAWDGNREGTPNAVKEAAATGLPVVASRHAGICDVVVDGKTGLLCDEGDIETMAGHMLRMVDEPAVAAEMGRAGREHVLAHFEMQLTIDRLWSILRDAAKG